MQEIAPGIFVESAYPPYNLGLIVTDHGPIVIDIPPRPSYAWAWQQQVEEIAGKPRYAVLTDASLERQIAASLWDVPIIAGEAMLRALIAYDERAWRETLQFYITQHPEEVDELLRIKPHPPTLTLDKHFLLHYHTPPLEFESVAGGAPGSLWLTMPELGLFFAGDTIVVDEPALLERTPDSKAWLNTLSNLARRTTVRNIVPGRGKAPIQLSDIEAQREFMRVMRRTARSLAGNNNFRLIQCAQDLGQTFYNAQGQKAVRRIRIGLEHLVAEIHQAKAATEEEAENSE
jgi:glyoxylase-like metal-dependent hydrolase (beta-lactamase superfamily II)